MPYSAKTSATAALEYLQRTWATQQDGVDVVIWFYDDLDATAGNNNFFICDNSSTTCLIGVAIELGGSPPQGQNYYVYRLGSTWYLTSIPRTLGWHKFEIDYTGAGVIGRIDGTQIFSASSPSTFNRLNLGILWGVSGYHGNGYWDDWDAGSLGSDNFESCNLAGWTLIGSPECSSEQDHTGAPPLAVKRVMIDGFVVL
jgi:hypothetical protein